MSTTTDLISQSIFYWLNYNNTVSMSDILVESSIRFPLAECLERRIKAQVQLEVEHPVFTGLRIDFLFEEGGAKHYIELKYLHEYSDRSDEQKRFFDDIVRLAVLEGSNFFILCGNRELYETRIKKYSLPPKKGQIPENNGAIIRPAEETIYPKWLPLDNFDDPQKFKPHDYYTYIGGKKCEHKEDRQIKDSLEIQTRLIAKQDDANRGSQVVYIWEVKHL